MTGPTLNKSTFTFCIFWYFWHHTIIFCWNFDWDPKSILGPLPVRCAHPPPWRNPRKGRDHILPSGNLAGEEGAQRPVRRALPQRGLRRRGQRDRRGRGTHIPPPLQEVQERRRQARLQVCRPVAIRLGNLIAVQSCIRLFHLSN